MTTERTPNLSKIYVDGDWTNSAGDQWIEFEDPTRGEVIGRVPDGTPADVDLAVESAKAAFPAWSSTSPEERAESLRALADRIEEHADELAELAATDIGTPLALGRFMHAALPATTFRDMADRIGAYEFERQDGNTVVRKEPVGVVGAITPWNFPGHQIAAKVAPALAAGCTVVLKPSEVAPLTAWRLTELVDDIGLPAGVFNLVSGRGETVGQALAAHEGTEMTSFTGSIRAGREVARAGVERVKRVTLELGGKSANVVLPDVTDLDEIVPGALKASFGNNSGQHCSALTRLIVPRERLAEVEELAARAASTFPTGDPRADGTVLGPLVSRDQFERVTNYIRTGQDEGAKLVAGGNGATDGPGYFVEATIFSDVSPDMTIAREEIFGPVLVIMPYEDEEEALEIANATDYGLSGGVWAGTQEHARKFAARMQTGQVKVNGGAFDPTAPFGGYRRSGLGRELGEFGLEEYFEVKALNL